MLDIFVKPLYDVLMGLSGKKLLLLGFVVVLMVVIPLTVYLVQQQQKLKVTAEKASRLFFFNQTTQDSTATITRPGDTANLEVWLDPATNQVSFVKLTITYDGTKLKPTLTPDSTNFPTTLSGPDVTAGKASITLSVGSDPTRIIKDKKRVATISFALTPTATAGTVPITFDADTQVLSIGTGDQFNENVLSSSPPTSVIIAQSAIGPGTSPTPTPVPLATCTSSSVDKQTTGTAPYPINLQASATTSTGTIAKVTYDWGDTQTQDFTTGFGIGTNSVNITQNHTYNSAGTFVAKVLFTDSQGGVSIPGNCTKTFIITAASASPSPTPAAGGGGTGGTSGTGTSGGSGTGTTQIVTVATPTPTVAATPTPTPVGPTTKGGLPAPGPGDNIRNFGILGIISTIVGVFLLFGL